MVWFDFKDLEARLLKGEVSDKHVFIYLLAQLGLMCVLLQLPFEEEPLWWVWLLLSTGVVLGGVTWTYRINSRGDHRNYLRRFISISFLAVVRCLLLVLFISCVEGIYAVVKTSVELSTFWLAFQEKALGVMRGFILIFYFIYLIPSFKRLKAAETEAGRMVEERQ